MYRLLNTSNIADPDLRKCLRSCIFKICKGHLDWCFDIAQMTSSKTWTTWYRPFGSRISDESDLSKGAIHLLKLFEASESLELGREYISQTLAKRLEGWIGHLHSSRNEKAGLWAASEKTESLEQVEDTYISDYAIKVPCYELCHSVLIWQATSAVYDMMATALSKSDSASSAFRETGLLKATCYPGLISVEELQAIILEKFCYDHTFPTLESLQMDNKRVSGHAAQDRLLAFSRDGTQKPRFHWNAESMILCEGYDWGIFAKPPSSRFKNDSGVYETQERLDEWWSSLKLQTFQHAALWKKPNRYVLALILASNSNFSIDGSIDAKTMVEQCSRVLLRSVLVDGRMAAEIDPLTQSPLFKLLGATNSSFDVPHYLLRQQYCKVLIRPISKFMRANRLDLGIPEWTQKQLHWNFRHGKSVRSLRKRGFYAAVDEAQVFENPCEPDWLFNDPEIFTNEVRPWDQDGLQAIVTQWQQDSEENDLIHEDFRKFIGKLTQFWYSNKSSFQRESLNNVALVDEHVKSNAKGNDKMIQESVCWPRELLELLRGRTRKRSEIKKRLMYV